MEKIQISGQLVKNPGWEEGGNAAWPEKRVRRFIRKERRSTKNKKGLNLTTFCLKKKKLAKTCVEVFFSEGIVVFEKGVGVRRLGCFFLE